MRLWFHKADAPEVRCRRIGATVTRVHSVRRLLGDSGLACRLRLLGGLEFPTAGRVLFDGADATNLSVQERRAGFVFQSYALFPHLTVWDNIAFGLRRMGMDKDAMAERLASVRKEFMA